MLVKVPVCVESFTTFLKVANMSSLVLVASLVRSQYVRASQHRSTPFKVARVSVVGLVLVALAGDLEAMCAETATERLRGM